MLITEDVLKALGASHYSEGWVLPVDGIAFLFSPSDRDWLFSVEDREQGPAREVVALEQVFGLIAKHFFTMGRNALRRDLLGMLVAEGEKEGPCLLVRAR